MKPAQVKYRLSGRDGGFFFRDDAQLRRQFAPWLVWLPCPVLWKIAVWWYYHG